MKIVVGDERVFPTLGIVAAAGDEVDVPEEAFPAPVEPAVVTSTSKSNKKDVNDGSAPLA